MSANGMRTQGRGNCEAVLDVDGLVVRIGANAGQVKAVRDVSFRVGRGETLCLVGESGCGKSVTSLALMGLLPENAVRQARRLEFCGTDLTACSPSAMNAIRGNDMAMIFQEPMTSLNPSLTIGRQLTEGYVRHRKGTLSQAQERAVHLLERVGVPSAPMRMRQYPHQLSGGLRQRVMIAMALMCSPRLIIADEPTTALDVTIQAQILELLKDIQQEFGTALLLITHDLGVVARVADRVAVMYAGQIIETGTAAALFTTPSHPYTRGLLACIPVPGRVRPGEHLGYIPGQVPSLLDDIRGCAFRNRCPDARAECSGPVAMHEHAGSAGEHHYRCILPPALVAAEAHA